MKITRNLCLEITKEGNLIRNCRFVRRDGISSLDYLAKKFEPYLKGEGDVKISLEELDLNPYRSKVIEVYRALKEKVPFGKTITYGELARATGTHPRFVGYCMSVNRFPLIIPCHRVMAKTGLGGYSYGIDIKRLLLRLEGVEA